MSIDANEMQSEEKPDIQMGEGQQSNDFCPRKPFIPILAADSTANSYPLPSTDESHPESILKAWTAMEVLSPATFLKPSALVGGGQQDVVDISNSRLPWTDGVRRFRKGYRLYYQIILGSIKMGPAIEALLAIYADSREQRPQAKGEAVLASVLVDDCGRLAGTNPTWD